MVVTETEQSVSLFNFVRDVGRVALQIGNCVSTISEQAVQIMECVKENVKDLIDNTRYVANRMHTFVWMFLVWYYKVYKMLPYIMIALAYNAFDNGDKEFLELFILEFLNLRPLYDKDKQGDRLVALWKLVKRSPNWMAKYELDLQEMVKYLAFSVIKEANKISQLRNEKDQLFGKIKNENHLNLNDFSYIESFNTNPYRIVSQNETVTEIAKFASTNLSKMIV